MRHPTTQALLMVQTLAPGFDLNGQEQAIGRIEATFATARKSQRLRQPRCGCFRKRTAGTRGADQDPNEAVIVG